jgi:nitroreductase
VAVCPARAVSMDGMADVKEADALAPLPSLDAVLDMIRFRRSIRQFTERKIGTAEIDAMLEAGRWTATASNKQGNRFIFVQEKLPELKRAVWQTVEDIASNNGAEAEWARRFIAMRDNDGVDYLFRNAPAAIYIATANTWDAGMAAQNLEYAAVTQGMGVLYDGFLARFTSRSTEALCLLQLDSPGAKPIAACMLAGYPAVRYYRTAPKRQVDAVVVKLKLPLFDIINARFQKRVLYTPKFCNIKNMTMTLPGYEFLV